MKPDAPTYEEMQQDHAKHWKDVGRIRDERYQVVKAMLSKPWRCTVCSMSHPSGSICPKCREARIIEVE